MYLDKMKNKMRQFFRKKINAFNYELQASTEQKIVDRIIIKYNKIRKDLAKDLDKLIINSSVTLSQNDSNFYSENSSLYRNLLNCELENNKNALQIIIRNIEFQFRDLSIKADSLKFDFEKQEVRKYVEEEINQRIASFNKNLEDYLKAILVYKHFNKDIVINQTPEIQQNNSYKKERIPMKPGRKKIAEMEVYALKYSFITQQYDKFNPEKKESIYKSMDDYFETISEFEGLNTNTFKNNYRKLRYKDLENYSIKNRDVFNQMITNHDFSEYPKVQDLLNKYKVRINSN